MLLSKYVLNNTDLDDKTEQIQVTRDKEKYKNAEYDDNIIEYLMKYLGRIEHKDDDKDLLDYLRKQAGLHRE